MNRTVRPTTTILISGAGIAGPTLAFWLERHGFQPTIVERAPRLRPGGHIIDFWGAGFDVADRMGLAPDILHRGYQVKEVREVDRSGARVGGFAVRAFVEGISGGRFTSLPRSELAAVIFDALGGQVETIFDDSIIDVEDAGPEVRVWFERTPPRVFDLLIGADGLHSLVRRLVFREARAERYLGLKVAAFSVAGYRPRDELVYVTHTDVGQQVGRFAMRNDRTMFLFVFSDPSPDVPEDLVRQKACLRERFSRSGWECPRILDALEPVDTLYMDRVSQIRIDRWTQGRVALLGDAAFCVSLLGGQGSALAMTAAYILAGELKRANDDHAAAFARYEERLRAFIAAKQQAAVRLSTFFAPMSRFQLLLRNQITKLLAIPFVTSLAVGREFRDRIELPEY